MGLPDQPLRDLIKGWWDSPFVRSGLKFIHNSHKDSQHHLGGLVTQVVTIADISLNCAGPLSLF